MSLIFPRSSTFAPSRHDLGPFFSLFNDTMSEMERLSNNMGARSFAPKFDVKENKESYTLEGELPGIEQKDIVIEFSDEQTITIKGRTEHRREDGPGQQRPTEATEVTGKEAENASKGDAGGSESKEVTTTSQETGVARHEPQHTYWVSERSVGEFTRSFSFPNRVDQENVKASLKNGVLSVVVPKMAKKKAVKRIEVE